MDSNPDFESILEDYPIRVLNFEGPLDLLLHLIKVHEVNVYDIPISLVVASLAISRSSDDWLW